MTVFPVGRSRDKRPIIHGECGSACVEWASGGQECRAALLNFVTAVVEGRLSVYQRFGFATISQNAPSTARNAGQPSANHQRIQRW